MPGSCSRLVLCAVAAVTLAGATPMTITVSGTGSGSLNGFPFAGVDFTFTFSTDTTAFMRPPCCDTLDSPGGTPATFTITGYGSGTVTDGTQNIYLDPTAGTIGMSHFNGGDLIDLTDPRLVGYRGTTSIGPITGTPSFVGTCPDDCSTYLTSLGEFSITSVSTVTFTVVVQSPPPALSVSTVTDAVAGSTHFSPGMPIEITGSGLGTSATDLPTVNIGGQTAPVLSFISDSDIIVQIPANTPVGSTTLTVTYKNATSSIINLTIAGYAPEIETGSTSAFYDASGNPITATSPAVTGSEVYLLAVGLGPTNPAQVTGTGATTSSPTSQAVQVLIGGVSVQPDYAGLFVGGTPGTYQVSFKVPAGLSSGVVPVSLTVGGAASNTVNVNVASTPVPIIASIVNGATFKAKGAAPNAFVSIFGSNFGTQDTPGNIFPATSFNGISVLFNGTPAPLYYVFGSSGQINLVVPSELPTSGTVTVEVQNSVGTSAPFNLTMASADVGLFRIADPSDASRNNGAVLFANTVWRVMPASMAAAVGFPSCNGAAATTVCGQPAKPKDVIIVFLTGLGLATPNGDATGQPLATGSLAPLSGNPLYWTVNQPTVTIGGAPATVSFSGITPGDAGLYQINVTIPEGTQTGDDVPIIVTMPNGSTDTVTIAVTPAS